MRQILISSILFFGLNSLNAQIYGDIGSIERDTTKLIFSTYFASNSDSITWNEKVKIDSIFYMGTCGQNLHIELKGFADARGNEEENLILAEKRIETVYQFLLEIGLPDSIITKNPIGEVNVDGENKSEDDLAIDRRVEINLVFIPCMRGRMFGAPKDLSQSHDINDDGIPDFSFVYGRLTRSNSNSQRSSASSEVRSCKRISINCLNGTELLVHSTDLDLKLFDQGDTVNVDPWQGLEWSSNCHQILDISEEKIWKSQTSSNLLRQTFAIKITKDGQTQLGFITLRMHPCYATVSLVRYELNSIDSVSKTWF